MTMKKYYEVIYQGIVVDALINPKYVKYVKKTKRFLVTDKLSSDGVISSDSSQIYCFFELSGYKMVDLKEIDEARYRKLISQISSGDVIYSEEMKASVEYLQNQKIAEMSTICNETIINGFDLVLSDGIKYHFSLTTQDQLNLITLSAEISAGAFAIPYHADDGLCKYYSASDMLKIIEMARNFKMYHTTYFNSLKAYIKSISNKEDIEKVWYGMTLDAEYQSDVLKEFMGQQI